MDELPPTHRTRRPRNRLTVRRARPVLLLGIAVVLGALASRQPDTQVPLPAAVTHLTDQAAGTVTTVTQTIAGSQPGLYHVRRDVDGDTIDVEQNGQKNTVRFLGIDTPETHDPRKPVQCFGEVAAAHTKALLEGKDVRLEPDPEDSDKDKYGRLLRYVYLPDGTLVNAELVKDGYAFAYTVFPITKLDEFRADEADARDHNRGLWAGCNVNASQQIKQTAGSK